MSRSPILRYPHEMSDADHEDLLELLKAHPGPVLLSTYANELYDEQLEGWTQKRARALAQCGKATTEVLWLNPQAASQMRQQTLFQGVTS